MDKNENEKTDVKNGVKDESNKGGCMAALNPMDIQTRGVVPVQGLLLYIHDALKGLAQCQFCKPKGPCSQIMQVIGIIAACRAFIYGQKPYKSRALYINDVLACFDLCELIELSGDHEEYMPEAMALSSYIEKHQEQFDFIEFVEHIRVVFKTMFAPHPVDVTPQRARDAAIEILSIILTFKFDKEVGV